VRRFSEAVHKHHWLALRNNRTATAGRACLLPGLVASVLVLRFVNSPFCALASTKICENEDQQQRWQRNSIANSPVNSVPTALTKRLAIIAATTATALW
jgi:hypothetical protein